MLVRAKQKCFVGGARRRPGELFDYEGLPAHYLEPVTEDSTGAPAPVAGPETGGTGFALPAPTTELESITIAGKVARIPKRPKDFLDEVL
jgi:hypothetical protein